MLAEAHALRLALLENLREQRAALDERHAAQVVAAEIGQVEDEVDNVLRGRGIERPLQRLEIGPPLRVEHGDLAVDPRGIDAQQAHFVLEPLEARGPVVAVAREEPHVVAIDAGEQPIAVELDLVGPAAARGRLVDEHRELRREGER